MKIIKNIVKVYESLKTICETFNKSLINFVMKTF